MDLLPRSKHTPWVKLQGNCYLVFADGHWDNLGLEGGGEVGHLKLGGHSLVGFHVEALDAVGTVDLGDELRMEADNDSRGDKHSFGVQWASAGNVARVERQLDAGDLTTVFVVSAFSLVKESLDVDVAFEGVASVEVDSDRSRAWNGRGS